MTMMNELILQFYESFSSSISRRMDIKAQMIPSSSSPTFQCLTLIIACFHHAIFLRSSWPDESIESLVH